MALFLSLIFGAVGGVFFALGRKDHDAAFLISGVALMVYPWFVSSALVILLVGAVLTAFPIARAKGLV